MAHADGTAFALGTRAQAGIKKAGTSKKKKNSSSKKSSGSSGNSGGGNSGNSSSSDSAAEEAEETEEILDWIEVRIKRIEAEIQKLETIADSAFSVLSTRTNAVNNNIAKTTEEIETQEAAYNRYMQQANSVGLDETWAAKVRDGLIEIDTITDEDLKEKISKYQEWVDKAYDARDAVVELKEAVKELYKTRFELIQQDWEDQIDVLARQNDLIETWIDETEARGHIVGQAYYTEMIANENKQISKLTSERAALQKQLVDAIGNGAVEIGSEAWYEMREAIDDVTQSIAEAEKKIADFKKSLREISWDLFDNMQDRIEDIASEAEFIYGLIDENKMFDERGHFTTLGLTGLGLDAVSYNTYLHQSQKYLEEIKKIDKDIAKDRTNQDLLKRRQELLKAQRDSISAAYKEREAIRDLVAEGINKQIEAMKKAIDEYEQLLDSQQDAYKYQQDIEEQMENITTLRKQIASWTGDDSEEGAARRQKTAKELADAEKKLEETQEERRISEIKEMLSSLSDQHEEILNARLDNIDALIVDVINTINENSGSIAETVHDVVDNVGYQMSEALNTTFNASLTDLINKSNGEVDRIVTTFADGKFATSMTTLQTAVNGIKSYTDALLTQAQAEAAAKIAAQKKAQAEQAAKESEARAAAARAQAAQNAAKASAKAAASSGGNGTPEVGDKVTFASGKYYYDSYGTSPAGSKHRGQEVYITKINNKSGATKLYHLGTQPTFSQSTSLGWVSLDQIKGYASGTSGVTKSGAYWTQENGQELIRRKSDGAVLTKLGKGDMVFTDQMSKTLWDFAKNPDAFLNANVTALPDTKSNITVGDSNVNINFNLPNVANANDFVRELQRNKEFERIVQTMTVGRLGGAGTLAKYGIKT